MRGKQTTEPSVVAAAFGEKVGGAEARERGSRARTRREPAHCEQTVLVPLAVTTGAQHDDAFLMHWLRETAMTSPTPPPAAEMHRFDSARGIGLSQR